VDNAVAPLDRLTFRPGQAVRLTKGLPGYPALRAGAVGCVAQSVGYWGLVTVEFPAVDRPVTVHAKRLEPVPGPEAA
jgi:hypothetical protein